MGTSHSSREKICPECRATISSEAISCWLCEARRSGLPPDEDLELSVLPIGPGEGLGQFSLAELFVAITALALCLGAWPLSPALALGLCFVIGPALGARFIARKQMALRKQRRFLREPWVSLAEAAVLLLTLVASAMAFFVTCATSMSIGWQSGPGETGAGNVAWVFAWGAPLWGLVAVVFAIWLATSPLWKGKR